MSLTGCESGRAPSRSEDLRLARGLLNPAGMKALELGDCLRTMVSAARAAYQPTPAHDALLRAAIKALSELRLVEAATPIRPAALAGARPAGGSPPPRSPGPVVPAAPSATERALLEVLARPAVPGETIDATFRRKEDDLAALLATLPLAEARALHRRLANPVAADELATRFQRLTAERRGRLLSILLDARRRDAVRATP